jgi:hypothetical protein
MAYSGTERRSRFTDRPDSVRITDKSRQIATSPAPDHLPSRIPHRAGGSRPLPAAAAGAQTRSEPVAAKGLEGRPLRPLLERAEQTLRGSDQLIIDCLRTLGGRQTLAARDPQVKGARMFRQGDILLVPVEKIPEDLKEVPREQGRMVLAHGEATGHAHVLEGEAQFLAADLEEMDGRFLLVEEEAELVHDEHDTITVPPGEYEVRRQREYQPEAPVWVGD